VSFIVRSGQILAKLTPEQESNGNIFTSNFHLRGDFDEFGLFHVDFDANNERCVIDNDDEKR